MQVETDEIDSDWSEPSDAVSTSAEPEPCTLNAGDAWCSVMGVETTPISVGNEATLFHNETPIGYASPTAWTATEVFSSPFGQLINTDFTFDGTTYTILGISWNWGNNRSPEDNPYQGRQNLHLELDPAPPSSVHDRVGTWTLQLGDDSFSFADDTILLLSPDRESGHFRFNNAYAPDDKDPPASGSVVTVRLNVNAAPSFSSDAAFDAAENQTVAGTVLAADSDADDDVTGYEITGGADEAFFSIGATDGALTFDAAPNYEDAQDIVSVDPANAAGNNQYVVVVTATSGAGTRVKTAAQTITVTVTDVNTEAPGKPAAPTLSSVSTTRLTVTWSAPSNAGPEITDYDYRHRTASPEGAWTEVTNTTIATLSATIGSLAENTSYDVQVRATNDEGTGDWSDSGNRQHGRGRQRGADVQLVGDVRREGEPDGGRHGAGDRQRFGRQRHGLRDHRRGGPGVLLHRGDLGGADVRRGAQLRGREGRGEQQHLRGDGHGDQRRGHAGEDGGADGHGDGHRRGRRSAGQAGPRRRCRRRRRRA